MVKVGFIGLGLMGKPMARNILKKGFSLAVYNRSRAPVEELASMGAAPCSSPAEVALRSEVLITMLPDEPQVAEVLTGVFEGMRSGLVLVDMSTVSPMFSRQMAAAARSRGGDMLDAPVSGSTMAAEQGNLTIMVGGSRKTFEETLPVLQAMGKNIFYMGESGAGSFAKLCNQIAVAVNLLGVCEMLLLASKAGLNLSQVVEVVSTGAGGSWQLANLGPRMISRDFNPGFKVKHLRKDLRIIREVSEKLGLPLQAVALVSELIKALDEKGHGEEGTQALIKLVETLASHQISNA